MKQKRTKQTQKKSLEKKTSKKDEWGVRRRSIENIIKMLILWFFFADLNDAEMKASSHCWTLYGIDEYEMDCDSFILWLLVFFTSGDGRCFDVA